MARNRPIKKNARFKNIEIALVEPQSPGNVGSVARAMKNTGFSALSLVNPCEYKNNDSYSMACKADDVLLKARIFDGIKNLIDGPSIVIGTTRRMGRARYPILTINEAVPVILAHAQKNRVIILFGREDRGLENDEISVCDMLVEIPTHSEYPSVNLSHAVFTVCWSLFMAADPKDPAIKATSRDELERMYEHMEETLRALSYGDKGGEYLLEAIMRSFRRLFGRTALMQKEVNMLRGIFTQIQERVKK